eukprot:SAG11_NODE_1963_length_3992_cov_3.333676_2_plen_650_part_00
MVFPGECGEVEDPPCLNNDPREGCTGREDLDCSPIVNPTPDQCQEPANQAPAGFCGPDTSVANYDSSADNSAIAATCAAYTPEDCATEANCAWIVQPIAWSASINTITGSCSDRVNYPNGCQDEEGAPERSTPCSTAATGCQVTNNATMMGSCVLTQPAEARRLVLDDPGSTDYCDPGCTHTPQRAAIDPIAEHCVNNRGSTAALCVGNDDTCAAATGSQAACEAAGDCEYHDTYNCALNPDFTDGTTDESERCVLTSGASTVPEPTCLDSNGAADDACTDVSSAGACEAQTAANSAACVYSWNWAYAGSYEYVATQQCSYVAPVAGNAQQVVSCEVPRDDAGEIIVGLKHGDAAQAAAITDATCNGADTCVVNQNLAGNCTQVGELFDAALEDECRTCWRHWQMVVADKLKGNLWPATIVIWSLFLFTVVLVCLNYYMIDNGENDDGDFEPGGIVKILGLVFNGVVCLFGLITMICGIYVNSTFSDGCPAGKDCTNWAVIGVIVLGVFFILTAILSLVGVILGGFVGKLLLRIANLIFLLLTLFLMIVGVGFAIIAGAMDDINSQYDDNFASVRQQYETQSPGICAGMDDAACKEKIKAKTQDSMTGLLVVLGIICVSFLVVMFLTLEAFYIYKGSDDDDDDDDEDGE